MILPLFSRSNFRSFWILSWWFLGGGSCAGSWELDFATADDGVCRSTGIVPLGSQVFTLTWRISADFGKPIHGVKDLRRFGEKIWIYGFLLEIPWKLHETSWNFNILRTLWMASHGFPRSLPWRARRPRIYQQLPGWAWIFWGYGLLSKVIWEGLNQFPWDFHGDFHDVIEILEDLTGIW